MAAAAALEDFRRKLAVVCRHQAACHAPAAAALSAVARCLEQASRPLRSVERRTKPALRLLPEALGTAADGPLAALADAFAALEPQLAWRQNPNYSDARMGAGYMADYAYAVVVGPEGPVEAEDVLVTLLLLGPGRLYPAHAHGPEEVYQVLAGDAYWWREGEDWRLRGAGSLIYHRPWQAHATLVGAAPLLALASWHGAVARPADLTAAATPPLPEW